MCCNNQLTEINDYPQLKRLYCSNNVLNKIPEFKNLKMLTCDLNVNLKIPYLKNLTYLSCIGCKNFKAAGIRYEDDYHNFLRKVDIIVVLIIHLKVSKKFLNIDLLRDMWNKYLN
jgi:hypothetical protein